MKKILVFLGIVFVLLFMSLKLNASCSYNAWSSIKDNLSSCLSETKLVNPWDAKVEGSFTSRINSITKTIAIVLSLAAVFWIAYWSFMMVTAWWQDEKIKKAKDIVKWSIIWFFWVVVASGLIALVVSLMYNLWKGA